MNTFGRKLTLTTFGESHGAAIGGVLDGMPAGVKIDINFIQAELDKRRPGRNKFATARNEGDRVEILSGVFEGVSSGAPIGFIIRNENQKSGDYENLRELFRPGHADYAYFAKYGVRDHRGGGRSSARETAVRVAGGAIAQLLLSEFGISVASGVSAVGAVECGENLDFDLAAGSEIFSLGNEEAMKEAIMRAREAHDSVGASVVTQILGAPAGLGEPLYGRLDAAIASAMMGINGVKAVEIGEGVRASKMCGSENNDAMGINFANFTGENGLALAQNGEQNLSGAEQLNSDKTAEFARQNLIRSVKFATNHAGGILGGMSTGAPIIITAHFKPTPSIFKEQQTINLSGEEVKFELRGRHDPCIGVRGSVVTTAMARLIVADMLLLNASANLGNLKRVYN